MSGILRAYVKATRSLFRPEVLGHFLWPVLVSTAAWVGLGIVCWDWLSHLLAGLLRHIGPLANSMAPGTTTAAAVATGLKIALYLLSIPLALATSVFILEIVALPFILERVANLDYPQIDRRHGGSQWQSLRNTAIAFAVAAGVAVVTLPVWLLPGAGVALSLGLSAWINYRAFRYDVLMHHADASELRALPGAHRGRLLLLALGAATLTLVPVVNLLAVPFAGLAFLHYLLHELAQVRARA
jgi:CysZ protein